MRKAITYSKTLGKGIGQHYKKIIGIQQPSKNAIILLFKISKIWSIPTATKMFAIYKAETLTQGTTF